MSEELNIPNDIKTLYLDFITRKNLRKTEEREAILKEICLSVKHIDVDMLHDRFRNTKYHISKSTLYNTLELFVEAGIIIRHQMNAKAKSEYELRKKAEKHIHLVCNECGKLYEVKLNKVLFINSVQELKSTFTPDYFSVFVYGTCVNCKKLAK